MSNGGSVRLLPKLSDEYNADDEDGDSNGESVDSCDTEVSSKGVHTTVGEDGYTEDWGAISAEKRARAQYRCERCGIGLTEKKKLLHVHHLDHNRLNNEDWNLLAVCVLCHSTFQKHHHLLQRESEQDLSYLRALQVARNGR
jgi:hypothetical protein